MRAVLERTTRQEGIQFQGVQEPALRAIQDGESPVVAVIHTGGGKSTYLEYRMGPSTTPDKATIVLVTPEPAVQEDFQTFLNRLQQTRRVDRIVIDKCHIVLLTATLPPQLEAQLFRRMGYTQAEVHMFRNRTSRPNVAYRVWRPDVGRSAQWFHSDPVITFIRERIRRAPGGKVVVYGHVVRHVIKVAQALECKAYHKQQVDKPGILRRFTQGETQVLTATSMLGMAWTSPTFAVLSTLKHHGGKPTTREGNHVPSPIPTQSRIIPIADIHPRKVQPCMSRTRAHARGEYILIQQATTAIAHSDSRCTHDGP
ncbi:uncharacterized protein ATNIH1004_009441 [Aspergillus tanneri]|uniref:Helicase ATP-binding domain-containing protein n=1 Tax=Aspergillus tanneri TaxID=1220188 RepID=A0A5M9MDU4_9EURO|nr:uncharacterized protein ATNIH1004_009441 [Aspergillus tanneri]KAA8642689.1 hypothetical protein ATNIH1004_009441 [Aspergillus tanneri]